MDLRDQLKNLFPEHLESEQVQENNPQLFEEIQKESLICKYEKKGRNGKPVTIVENFLGNEDELKELAKSIKSKLGVGGTAKDELIIIQGDYRDKIMELLKQKGFKVKRVGG